MRAVYLMGKQMKNDFDDDDEQNDARNHTESLLQGTALFKLPVLARRMTAPAETRSIIQNPM
jgi:hypothetical protein